MTTPDQIIIYNTDDGHSKVQLLIQDGSAWLTTSQMATLFDVGQHAINHHIREVYKAKELDPSKSKKLLQQAGHDRSINHYNLEMIIAVGYRVKGDRGTQFRRWATTILHEYLEKGFALDDKRLKNEGAFTRFDELLERIREIRTSERQFFRKICDVIKESSDDYSENYETTRNFFASIQNKLHFATHGRTAAELIYERADHNKQHAGLTSWAGDKPHKSDTYTAKNYLNQDELSRMNRLTNMFLDYAEDRAIHRQGMLLSDWIALTDRWLIFNEREVLQGFGSRTMQQAKKKASQEWDAYMSRLDREVTRKDMSELEAEVKALNQKRRTNQHDS